MDFTANFRREGAGEIDQVIAGKKGGQTKGYGAGVILRRHGRLARLHLGRLGRAPDFVLAGPVYCPDPTGSGAVGRALFCLGPRRTVRQRSIFRDACTFNQTRKPGLSGPIALFRFRVAGE